MMPLAFLSKIFSSQEITCTVINKNDTLGITFWYVFVHQIGQLLVKIVLCFMLIHELLYEIAHILT